MFAFVINYYLIVSAGYIAEYWVQVKGFKHLPMLTDLFTSHSQWGTIDFNMNNVSKYTMAGIG